MIAQLAKNMAGYYAKKNIVPQEEIDVYAYGFELLISTVCNVLLVLCVASILDVVLESMFFMLSFVLMCAWGGGYHAKTHAACIWRFTGIFTFLALLHQYIPNNAAVIYISLCTIIASLIIWNVAPVEAPNKPLTGKKREQFKNNCLLIASCYMAITIFLCLSAIQIGSNLLFMFSGLLAAALSMAVAVKNEH